MRNLSPPSKRLLLSFGVVIVLVIIAFMIPKTRDAAPILNDTPTLGSADTLVDTESFAQDTDGDGLPDWEEALWRTDTHNPDTDGDGTSDGEEVAAERHPLVAGPGDAVTEVSTNIIVDANNNPVVVDQDSQTNRFAQNFLSRYFSLKQQGTSFESPEDISGFVGSLYDDLLPQSTALSFTTADLTATDNHSASVLRLYGNVVGALIFEEGENTVDAPTVLSILNTAITTRNETELEKLAPIVSQYERIRNGLLDVPVPQNIAQTHLRLLNNISAMLSATTIFQKALRDPLIAFGALSPYQTAVLGFSQARQAIGRFLQTNNVVFSPDEEGYLLLSQGL